MLIFPSLRVWATRAHSDAIKGGRKNQIPIAALLFGDKRGEGLVDGLGEVADELTGLPDKGVDLTPFIIQTGELPRVDSVKRRCLVDGIGRTSLPNLLGGKSGKGSALGNGNMAPKGASSGAAPKLLTFAHYFIEVSLGVNTSTPTRLNGLVGNPRLRPSTIGEPYARCLPQLDGPIASKSA